MKKQLPEVRTTLEAIVGGGQTLGTHEDGRKLFTWGGLPGEDVTVQITKKKSKLVEGIVNEVHVKSENRIEPRDPDSYLSTSPWQIMNFDAEQHYKAALIEEAFELHDIVLPEPISVHTDGREFEYRNKIEYSFWFDTETEKLSLAFFRRGTHGKIPIEKTSLAKPEITVLSQKILAALNAENITGRELKTLLIRSNETGETAWQLYVKDETFPAEAVMAEIGETNSISGEIIFSNPKSPASVITKRLLARGGGVLHDTILGVDFAYATEGFFQINLPLYEHALKNMRSWLPENKPIVDMYSGVGTIGLTIGGDSTTLVEINEHAVREMKNNIARLERHNTNAVLAASEDATEYITSDACVILDPPRAGLHETVVHRLLEQTPERIIYLSCNPVTQARDVARLAEKYGIRAHAGYNFFPRTPHIEHLVILDLKQ